MNPTTSLDSWARDLLRCPENHSELVDRANEHGEPELWSTAACDEEGSVRAYPVQDGIPVLLLDEARLVPAAEQQRWNVRMK